MRYDQLVPQGTYIHKYMKSMHALETPFAYDFWCAIWTIGAACGRNVCVNRPRSPVRLNWFVVLAADSGSTRKSTAVSVSSKIIGRLGIPIISTERRLRQLLTEPALEEVSIAVGELSRVMGKQASMKDVPDLIIDMYDSDTPLSPFGSFISASTPGRLVSLVNPVVVESGFASRVLFVVADRPKRPVSWPSGDEETEIALLASALTECVNADDTDKIGMNAKALKRYDSWYKHRLKHFDSFRASFEAREDDHVLRLAACLCINDGTWEIQLSHIRTAVRIIADTKETMHVLLSGDQTASTRITAGVDRMRKKLVAAGSDGLQHRDLYLAIRTRLNIDEYRTLIKIMHECDLIQVFETVKGRTRLYRATGKLLEFGSTASIISRLSQFKG